MWAATSAGRVFITDNANDPAGVRRLDAARPARRRTIPAGSISAIYVDPANAHHAWISYNGYNFDYAGAARATSSR